MQMEDLFRMLMMNMESIQSNVTQERTNFNIVARVLYEKGIITNSDIFESTKKEFAVMKAAGIIPEMPNTQEIHQVADAITIWMKSDSEEIGKRFKNYQELIKKESEKAASRIETVPGSAMSSLNNAARKGKIIV